MTRIIIVGLGPAGAALAHRAKARGWTVTCFSATDFWPATYGLFADEIPAWLHLPTSGRFIATVTTPEGEFSTRREYVIVDNEKLRRQLLRGLVVHRTEAEIIDATTVKVGDQFFVADYVIDATGAVASPPFQQALGILCPQQKTDRPRWMDWAGDRFFYCVPVAGGFVHEETILRDEITHPWETFAQTLSNHGLVNDKSIIREERVLIPLGEQPQSGPAVAFGARANFIHPATGYSLATSLRLVDDTLRALEDNRPLPWERFRFRLDRALLSRGAHAISRVGGQALMTEFCRLSPTMQRRFLTLGDPTGTFFAMARIFWHAPFKRSLLKAVFFP